MRQSAAIILSAAALVMFSSEAEARGFKMSFGKSSARAATPVSKPVAANAAAPTSRGTFVMIGGGSQNQSRPFAAAPRDPAPEGGPLHDLAYAAAQMPSAETPTEKPVEQKPEPPAVQTTPVFVSSAVPAAAPAVAPVAAKPTAKPAERMASAQPVRTVYCVKQANGACAPF